MKGWKKLLAKRVEERMGHFETMEQYSISCILDPRWDMIKDDPNNLDFLLKIFDLEA